MGKFDDITCKYPLPVEGANGLDFQTKDTPAQYMDKYQILADGMLWHEEYDTEDHSERAIWNREHPNEPLPKELSEDELSGFCGCMTRVNKRWVPQRDFTGEIRFYTNEGPKGKGDWIEFSSYFVNGKLSQVHQISPEPAGGTVKL